MPELIPFPALRYTASAGEMSVLIAPPYDVIDELQAVDLRARSPHNCVRLVLPEGPPELRYGEAAETLTDWIESGMLAHDAAASVYVYRQTFPSGGTDVTRHAVFCALRLSPFDAGQVLPHERTHTGPKKDRLALTLATAAQLSPIFMIARDSDSQLLRLLTESTHRRPHVSASTPDGIRHALWAVGGEPASAICAAAGCQPLLIADGHHRYETALVAQSELGSNVKAAFVLVCVVSQQDPGLVVQPTHRVLLRSPDETSGFDWPAALSRDFRLERLSSMSPRDAELRAAQAGGGSLVAFPSNASGEAWVATPSEGAVETGASGLERGRLAPVVFDTLVLRRLYGVDANTASRSGCLRYSRSPEAAVQALESGGCAFLLPPLALEDVWETAASGGRLPPKSTYFEPKIPSGLLFRTL